jgi:hypothetical protein
MILLSSCVQYGTLNHQISIATQKHNDFHKWVDLQTPQFKEAHAASIADADTCYSKNIQAFSHSTVTRSEEDLEKAVENDNRINLIDTLYSKVYDAPGASKPPVINRETTLPQTKSLPSYTPDELEDNDSYDKH